MVCIWKFNSFRNFWKRFWEISVPFATVFKFLKVLVEWKVPKISISQWALTICMENSEIPGRIQMERFIPVESFRKKSNGFRGITVVPFLPKRPKFLVPFVWISRLHVERKRKIDRYFVNGTIQSRSCFRCQMFHRNFRTNGKCSWCLGFELAISRSTDRRLSNWATDTMPDFISETLNFSERYFYQQKTNLVPRSRRLRRQGIWVRDHEKKGMSWEDEVNTSDVFLFYAGLKLLGTPCLQFLTFMWDRRVRALTINEAGSSWYLSFRGVGR